MSHFDSIESSHQYLDLLNHTLTQEMGDVEVQLESATGRRKEGLLVVHVKLRYAAEHLQKSRRLLNDLKMLRRVLCQ